MADARPKRLILVYADWCPYCFPLSTDHAPLLAERLGVPLLLLDIDDATQERISDVLVEKYGDWTPDYLIPQVFLEWSDGAVTHLLTGVPGPLETTRRLWDRLIAEAETIADRGPSAPPPRVR
jgi:thiol-disulfide isomerase/thioredoxin